MERRKINFVVFFMIMGITSFSWGLDKYPNRPIELVVPMAPGGSNDTSARIYSDDLSKTLKVPVIVVNRPGGTGIFGASYVAKAKKDGYTLLQGSANSLITMPVVSKEVTYSFGPFCFSSVRFCRKIGFTL